MRTTWQAELPKHSPAFTAEEIGTILGLNKPVEFKTPGGRGVHLFKIEVADDKIVLHAYN